MVELSLSLHGGGYHHPMTAMKARPDAELDPALQAARDVAYLLDRPGLRYLARLARGATRVEPPSRLRFAPVNPKRA